MIWRHLRCASLWQASTMGYRWPGNRGCVTVSSGDSILPRCPLANVCFCSEVLHTANHICPVCSHTHPLGSSK